MSDPGSGERRQGNLRYEPDEGLLVVGARTAVLERQAQPSAVVGTYVELVVSQRAAVPQSHLDLRNRELVQLSALLELPAAELDALIDRELARLLGGPPALDGASALGSPVGAASAWLSRRRLLVVGGIAAAAAVGAATLALATQGTTAAGTGTLTGTGGSVEVIDLPGGGTATRTESDPAPVAEDGTDVGTAVVIERNP